LLLVLRAPRGYPKVISWGFRAPARPGPYHIWSSVPTNVPFAPIVEIWRIFEPHGRDFDQTDLETTRGFLLRANAGAFETAGAKLGLLGDMSLLGFPADYVLRREQVVRDMTVPRVRELADEYLDLDGMIWLVVGDARTQLPRLRALELGEPILLDRDGRPVD
jgi:zinc protease